MRQLRKYFLVLLAFFASPNLQALPLPKQKQVLDRARDLLENWSISYVYGGNRLGEPEKCKACNSCLGNRTPDPKERLRLCPVCAQCSLDCSHYIYEVFKQAGLSAVYLTTATMNDLDPENLAREYHLIDIGTQVERTIPGDLLVYNGHVVMLEKKLANGLGDVIHVTSGRDLRGPGLGIQRERHANLQGFRGPLLRILRHLDLAKELRDSYLSRKNSAPVSAANVPSSPHE